MLYLTHMHLLEEWGIKPHEFTTTIESIHGQ